MLISIDISGENAFVDGSYLFTEKKSLKEWWVKTFGYYQSDEFKKIPEEFMYFACPAPPSGNL